MNTPKLLPFRRTPHHSIEPLEARIAPAAVVDLAGSDLSVVDGAGAVDTIDISVVGANYHFSDPGGIVAGSGATMIDANNVEVPISSVTGTFTVMTNAGDDTVTFSTALATNGDLTVDTGTGADSILINGALNIGGQAHFTSFGTISFVQSVTMGFGKNLDALAVGTLGVGANLATTGPGTITLTTQQDILLVSGANITSVDGNISLSANAGGNTAGSFEGIRVDGASVTASGNGTVGLTGTGGDTGMSQFGIHLLNGAMISGGTGPGDRTFVVGHGGNVAGGNANAGLVIDSGTITSGGGNVVVMGVGGNGAASGESSGVYMSGNGAHITSGGTGLGPGGNVSVTGTGGDATTSTNTGVDVRFGAQITSLNGNLQVQGTGGPNPASVNPGVRAIIGGRIEAGGVGLLTVIGTGGAGSPGGGSDGVVSDTGAAFIGALSGAADITGQATDGFSLGIKIANASIATGNGGPLMIHADSIDIQAGGSITSGIGPTAISPRTAGAPIDLGGVDVISAAGPVTLGLSGVEMGRITGGFITIGDPTSGAIAVSAPIVLAGPTNLTLASGVGADIVFSGSGSLDAAGGNVSLDSGAGISSGTAANDVLCGALNLSFTANVGTAAEPLTFDATGLTISGGVAAGTPPNAFVKEANMVGLGNIDGIGTLTLAGGKFVASGPNTINSSTDVAVNTTLDLNGFAQTFSGLSGTGKITNDNATAATLTFGAVLNAAGNQTFDGLIQDGLGAVAITKVNGGASILNGSNTYSGRTTVTAGTLEMGTPGSALNGPLTLSGGIILYNFGNIQTISPDVTLTSSLGGIAVGGDTRTNWTGTLSGAGQTFIKSGPGTLTHDSHAFTATQIQITEGSLAAIGNDAFGKIPIDVATDCAFWVEGSGLTIANNITLHGGSGGTVAGSGVMNLGALVHNTGGGLATFTGKITLAAGTNSIGTDGGDITITGKLTGPGDASKDGAGTLILGNKHNDFGGAGSFILNAGTLQIPGDGALGAAGNTLVLNGGILKTTTDFTLLHDIDHAGSAALDITGTLTIGGGFSGAGTVAKIGAGTLLLDPNAVGDVSFTAGEITAGGSTLDVTGTGTVTVTIVPDGNGGTHISALTLADTDANSVIAITGPKTGTTTIDTIFSLDPNDEVGTVKLGKTVTLGNGVADSIPDVDIRGKSDKLLLNDIAANTIINLGKGLAYLDTYNNHPDIKLRTVLGAGVTFDLTGDGVTPGDMGGIGGGGLGKINVKSWSTPGVIKTTQSIGSFKLKKGDCNVVFEVDKLHLGSLTTGDIGAMNIPKGAWGSSGSQIEGTIGSFNAASFLAAATISAANIASLTIKKGAFSGTATLTDPDSAGLGTFSVNGDFSGYIDAASSIQNLNIRGEFLGSLQAKSIGSITAFAFDGTTTLDSFGDPNRHNIITTGGSLGTIKTSAGGIKEYEIVVNTICNGFNIKATGAKSGSSGIDHVSVEAQQINNIAVVVSGSGTLAGIHNSIFESDTSMGNITSSASVVGNTSFSAGTNIGNVAVTGNFTDSRLLGGTKLGGDGMLGGAADTFSRAGAIGNVTVSGTFATSTIAVGIDPVDNIYGNGNDLAAAGTATAKALGALVFGAPSGKVTAAPTMTHSYGIEAPSIKSLKIGPGKNVTDFTLAQYLKIGTEDPGDVFLKVV